MFKALPPRLPALMFAEAVWKQIEKKGLPAAAAVDTQRVRALEEKLTDESLGRMLFEMAAAAGQGPGSRRSAAAPCGQGDADRGR